MAADSLRQQKPERAGPCRESERVTGYSQGSTAGGRRETEVGQGTVEGLGGICREHGKGVCIHSRKKLRLGEQRKGV